MNLWLYSGPASLRALTNQESGTNLPEELGPWKMIRAVQLRGLAPDEREAIALIEEHGYCCFE